MEDRLCLEGAPCAMHESWEEGQETILDYLEAQTLSEFVSQTASQVGPTGGQEEARA